MQGLMLHCGADAITRTELEWLDTPAPMGPRHFIRPFIDDVNSVVQLLGAQDMQVVNEGFGVTKNNEGTPQQFFGLLEVESSGRDHGIMVGMRGSYNQTLPRGIAIGSRVFVCDNLCFSGEIEFKTKQTLDIDNRIAGLLQEAIEQVPGMVNIQDNRFDNYRLTRIGRTVGNSILTDLVRGGVLNPTQVGKAIQEWDTPTHAEHAEDGWSLWRLHNAVTEAIKPTGQGNAVRRNWGRTIELTAQLDRELERRQTNAERRAA